MSNFRTLDDVDVKGKRVLLRVDLNVPMEHGHVTDLTRLERIAATILEISGKGGKVILLAHSTKRKKTTTRPSSPNWRNSATSGSTTPSRRRTARTLRPRASATNCRPMPGGPCRPNSTR